MVRNAVEPNLVPAAKGTNDIRTPTGEQVVRAFPAGHVVSKTRTHHTNTPSREDIVSLTGSQPLLHIDAHPAGGVVEHQHVGRAGVGAGSTRVPAWAEEVAATSTPQIVSDHRHVRVGDELEIPAA
jgi:hypothetical protein